MKKTKIIALLIFTLSIQTIYSQRDNNSYIDAYNFTPKENIFVHYNTSLLFAGEYLYYKVYCLNATHNQLSKLSKVAYVELISEDKQKVFRHKISLKNGLGQGDFFISTSIPSGNYKIIAYTQWMKNGGRNYFFQGDISIINPYLANQKSIMDTTNISTNYNSEKNKIQNSSYYLKLTTNSEKYKKREKVAINIINLKEVGGHGNYSISVRKLDTVNSTVRITAIDYKKNYSNQEITKNKKVSEIYNPEINGGIISGSILNNSTNLPAQEEDVSISIPGKNFIFKTVTTDENGAFNISIKENHIKETGIIQVLGEDRENFSVEITETPSVDLSQLKFNSFKITPSIKEMVLERSIYNQIENGYYAIKPDTIVSLPAQKPFYSDYNSTVYTLEDYAKFNTVKDVFIEIVEDVWTTKNKNGDRVFYVRNFTDNNKNHLPLIFMDGVLIQNHNHLIEYKANKIKKIEILQGEAHFGTSIYQGVIIVETIDGDYKNLLKGGFLKELNLFNPQPTKNYFHQVYNDNSDNSQHIPDFRNQLLWSPNIKLNTKEQEISFYTSDNSGDYEICLEGFTIYGKPITIRKVIHVE